MSLARRCARAAADTAAMWAVLVGYGIVFTAIRVAGLRESHSSKSDRP